MKLFEWFKKLLIPAPKPDITVVLDNYYEYKVNTGELFRIMAEDYNFPIKMAYLLSREHAEIRHLKAVMTIEQQAKSGRL